MALMDFIKKQFIDVIQWTEDGDGTLAWRFPMAGMEIQNGGQLVVRESQVAVFVNPFFKIERSGYSHKKDFRFTK